MTTVLGVRHGEVHNPGNVIYAGLPGYGLSHEGRVQAAAVAQALQSAGVEVIYSSPLTRAVQTAEVIARATDAAVIVDERLHEWHHWTRWAGRTWDEFRQQAPADWDRYRDDPGSITDGETLEALAGRFLEVLHDARVKHPDGLVVLVTHLEPLRAALLRLTDHPAKDLFDIQIPTGGCVRLFPDPDPVPGDPRSLSATRRADRP